MTEVCQVNISSTIWSIKCRFDSAGIISRGRDVISGRENSNAVQKLRTRSTGPVAISSPKHANANWIYLIRWTGKFVYTKKQKGAVRNIHQKFIQISWKHYKDCRNVGKKGASEFCCNLHSDQWRYQPDVHWERGKVSLFLFFLAEGKDFKKGKEKL